MAMRDRYLTFAGTNLKSEYGLHYSKFEETLPEPKIITADIPGGADIDLSEAVGSLGWKNGVHKLTFLLYGDTQAERLEKGRAVKSLLHGVRASYSLSWDPSYTYTGRAKVEIEHRTENSDLVTVTIDRAPWKVSGVESVTLNCHPTDSASLRGSRKYKNVQVVLRDAASVKVGSGASQSLAAGTHTLASEVVGDTTVQVTISSWLYYVTEAGDMVVNPNVTTTVSGTDIAIDSPYTVSGTNMVFSAYANQTATVKFTRADL